VMIQHLIELINNVPIAFHDMTPTTNDVPCAVKARLYRV